MKIKLLKKVRRRFKIIHCPKGIVRCNELYEGNYYELIDKENSWRNITVQVKSEVNWTYVSNQHLSSDKEAIDYLKKKIIDRLKGGGYGTNKSKTTKAIAAQKQIWP
jgi:hypothetical protein